MTRMVLVLLLALACSDSKSEERPKALRPTGGNRPGYHPRFTMDRSKSLIGQFKSSRASDPTFSLREYVSSQPTDQNGCSTCWIFSAVAAFEAAYARKHQNPTFKMSEERVYDCVVAADCDHYDNPWTAFEQLAATGTITAAEDPYIPEKSACGVRPGRYFAVEPLYIGDSPTTEELKESLTALGPITVSLLANNAFMSWRSPTVFDSCDGEGERHYVLLVGWNEQGWLIKNSWQDWGTEGSGFGWIRYGCNEIGTFAMAIHAK